MTQRRFVDREDELYETFVVQYGGFSLTKPTGAEEPNEIDADLYGDVVNLSVNDEGEPITALHIAFDAGVLDYLPPKEDRVENAANFLLEKDDIEIVFDKQSRVGPLFTILVPSTQKSHKESGIEATREILCRFVYTDVHLFHYGYELLEAGYDLDLFFDNEVIEDLEQDLEEEEVEETMRYFIGSISGNDPEFNLEESG